MSWLQLVTYLSADVVTRLAAAGLPPLVDGAILLGPEHEAEHSSAPRIVFVPTGSVFTARRDAPRGGTSNPLAPGAPILYIALGTRGSGYTTATVTISAPTGLNSVQATATAVVTNGAVSAIRLTNLGDGYLSQPTVTITGDGTGATAVAAVGPSREQLTMMATRALWSEAKKFRVSVWGVTYTAGEPTPNPDSDWDFTEMMYDVLIQSMQALFGQGGGYRLSPGQWVSSQPNAPKLDVFGRWYQFEVEFGTPVPDTSLLFVPVGTMGRPTMYLQNPTGSPEAA